MLKNIINYLATLCIAVFISACITVEVLYKMGFGSKEELTMLALFGSLIVFVLKIIESIIVFIGHKTLKLMQKLGEN